MTNECFRPKKEAFIPNLTKKWKSGLARTTPVLALLLGTASMAHATMLDSLGNYMYGGFTGPFAKAMSLGILGGSFVGMHNSEGRAHKGFMTGAIASGGVLAAPLLQSEFRGAVGGFLVMHVPLLHSMAGFFS